MGTPLMQSWAEAFAAVGTVAAFGLAAGVFLRQQLDRRYDEARQARLILSEIVQDDSVVRVRVTNHSIGVITDLTFVGGE